MKVSRNSMAGGTTPTPYLNEVCRAGRLGVAPPVARSFGADEERRPSPRDPFRMDERPQRRRRDAVPRGGRSPAGPFGPLETRGDPTAAGIVLVDGRGRIVSVDERAEAMFGHRGADLLGTSLEVLIPSALLWIDRDEGGPDGSGPGSWNQYQFELIGRRRDGSELPVEVGVGRLELNGESLLACLVRDSTARRRLEEEQERFFRLSIDMLCIAGLDGYFKRINPAWHATLGYPVETLLNAPFLDFVHHDDREATLSQFHHLLEGGDVIAFENRYR